jgi:hypothetical protein
MNRLVPRKPQPGTAATPTARRDPAIDEINERVRALMIRGARGHVGRIEKWFHVRREQRATEALQASSEKLRALADIAQATTDTIAAAMEWRAMRVKYEAQTRLLPFALAHEIASYLHEYRLAALERDTQIAAAHVQHNLAIGERAASDAKLLQLLEKLDAHDRARNGSADADYESY